MIDGFLSELLHKNDGVVAAVSGGADSVCLLLNLLELREALSLRLTCVYVEHGIRGEESVEDGRFVMELCDRLGVDFLTKSVDAPSLAAREGISEEEAARNLRYETLKEIAKERGYGYIAVAHNANDNAETIIFQMIRGTGIAGLMGMEEAARLGELTILRPLLHVSRAGIEKYLDKLGQGFVTDSTNLLDEYTRNRIRHRVMPELVAINPKAIEHINESAAMVREVCDAGDSAKDLYDKAIIGQELSIEVLRGHAPSLIRSVIRLWIRDIGMARDVGRIHYEAIEALTYSDTGKSVDLPGGQRVERVYDRLRLKRNDTKPSQTDEELVISPLSPGEMTQIDAGGYYIRLRLYAGEEATQKRKKLSFQKNYAKYYDYGKIGKNMVLRHRREGDYLIISADGRRKSLGRYFVDQKIPRDEREEAWLLCTDSKVILAVGYRGSEDMRVDEDTTQILEVEFWRN